MTRRSLSTNCCHCGTGMRLIYRCDETHDPTSPFKLRAACPACRTHLVILKEEVYYDESRLNFGCCHTDAVLNTSRTAELSSPLKLSSPIPISRKHHEATERIK